jgi:hypothetical protein
LAASPWAASADPQADLQKQLDDQTAKVTAASPDMGAKLAEVRSQQMNISVSVNGVNVLQRGNAQATTTAGGLSVATARGATSSAEASDCTQCRAMTTGTESTATAANGSMNYATTSGIRADAFAGNGTGNRADAEGADSFAAAGLDGTNSDFNTAKVTGGGTAIAGSSGDNNDHNSATATDGALAAAGGGFDIYAGNNNSGNTADADGANQYGGPSVAFAGIAGQGNDDNTATASDGGTAQSGSFGDGNDDNAASAFGQSTVAVAGGLGNDNTSNAATATNTSADTGPLAATAWAGARG